MHEEVIIQVKTIGKGRLIRTHIINIDQFAITTNKTARELTQAIGKKLGCKTILNSGDYSIVGEHSASEISEVLSTII